MIKKGLYAILAIVLIMGFSFHVYNALAGVDCSLSARTGWNWAGASVSVSMYDLDSEPVGARYEGSGSTYASVGSSSSSSSGTIWAEVYEYQARDGAWYKTSSPHSVSDRDGTVSDQTFGSASRKREAAHCHWRSSLRWQMSMGKHIRRLRLRALQQPPQGGEYSQQLIGGRNRLRFPPGFLKETWVS